MLPTAINNKHWCVRRTNNFIFATLSLCSFLKVTDQVSHPYKTAGKILVLSIFSTVFSDSELEHKRCWSKRYQEFLELNRSYFLHEWNFDLLWLFPNKWIVPPLHRKYCKSLCCDFVLLPLLEIRTYSFLGIYLYTYLLASD